MSDFLSGQTGIAPGFGGFAATPGGQAQYMARQHNPYAFLQRSQPVDTSTAPAAADQMLAGGGLVSGLSPQQMLQWSRFMRSRANGGYAKGGLVPRFDEGGDTGSDPAGGANDSSNSQGASADSGQATGFDSSGFGGPGFDGSGTFDSAGFGGTAPGSSVSSTGQAGTSAFDADMGGMFGTAAPDSAPRGPDFGIEDPSFGQAMAAGIGKGLTSSVPGLGLASMATQALGLGSLSNMASNALGIGQMSKDASFGSSVMGTVGGLVGGPVGAALGAAVGGYMGAHGENGPGQLGGTFGGGSGMGGPSATNSSSANPDPTTNDTNNTAALIAKLNKALGIKDAQSLASGGRVRGGAPNHNFRQGSGLVHGATDGRADALETQVPPGGYVVPADVVSGLGEGNTMGGAKKLRGMMPQQAPSFATGGAVPVRLSAGEFYVHPAHVAALGNGSLKAGSDKLDAMVGHVRRASVRQTMSLPPPK